MYVSFRLQRFKKKKTPVDLLFPVRREATHAHQRAICDLYAGEFAGENAGAERNHLAKETC